MAKLSVNICDLCKKVLKEDLPYRVIIRGKTSKAFISPKGTKYGDICIECFEGIITRLESANVLTTINTTQQGEAKLVPSANKTPIAKGSIEKECSHERRTFDDVRNVAVCRECGNEEKA